MAIRNTSKISTAQTVIMNEATSKRRKDRHTPYLQRVKEALSRSLLKMEPYEEEKYIQKKMAQFANATPEQS